MGKNAQQTRLPEEVEQMLAELRGLGFKAKCEIDPVLGHWRFVLKIKYDTDKLHRPKDKGYPFGDHALEYYGCRYSKQWSCLSCDYLIIEARSIYESAKRHGQKMSRYINQGEFTTGPSISAKDGIANA